MAEIVASTLVGKEPPIKRAKVEENGSNCEESIHAFIKNFAGFETTRILSESSQRKTICIEGSFEGNTSPAIVILEKKPFSGQNLKNILNIESILSKDFINDIYGNYECFPKLEYNGIKTTIIHPATEKHIKKFESQPIHLVEETPELYESITYPHLQTEQFDLTWVHNILEHKSEVDRIVFEDSDPTNGFILLPDLKWDGKQIENLYLVGIVNKKGIKSLRDLTGEHLNLLKNLMEKGCNAIEEKYKLPRSKLRVYLHYQPSFYHLHVHFTNLKYDAPGIYTEKSHLLAAVINNIELMPEYFQRVTLPFVLKETDKLFLKYEEKGVVKKC
uniref:m7GpppX diphosphatase n=1 Tax=Timema cristinae TaxID=61476 RepID=A0A7R9CA62_TIMCR|nr:unnamed protein product [Timema cristinae]